MILTCSFEDDENAPVHSVDPMNATVIANHFNFIQMSKEVGGQIAVRVEKVYLLINQIRVLIKR